MKNMLVGAHRGAYKDEPALDENSLSAFKRAIDFKVDYVEFDVHKTTDGKYVIYHDNSLLINNQKINMKELSWFNVLEEYRLPITNEQLPLLEEVVKVCKGKMKMNVEIKDPAIGVDVVNYLISLGLTTNDFLISSFHESVMNDISNQYKDIYTGFLFLGNFWSTKKAKRATELSCNAIHPYYRFLTKKILTYATNNNLDIHTWTVDGKALTKVMKKNQVTSIMSNDVLLALETRESLGLQ